MVKATEILNAAEDTRSALLEQQLNEARKVIEKVVWENDRMVESISQMDTYLDLRGWTPLTGIHEDGPALRQLHAAAKRIRELAVMNVHVNTVARDLRLGEAWIHRHLLEER